MKKCARVAILIAVSIGMPLLSNAQSDIAGEVRSLQEVLEQLYEEMLPLCSGLISVGR